MDPLVVPTFTKLLESPPQSSGWGMDNVNLRCVYKDMQQSEGREKQARSRGGVQSNVTLGAEATVWDSLYR